MNKGILIGMGRTAEVYEWGDDKALKLYFQWYNDEWIKDEEEIGRVLCEKGVPCPRIFGVVEEEGRKGIIYEKLSGLSILKAIEAKPWKCLWYGRKMAEIHSNVHSFHTDKLPEQKAALEWSVNESRELLGDSTEKVIEYLQKLPTGTSVCHGDFHPDNIMMFNGSYKTIDWTNSSYGNPLADVARTLLMFQSTYIPPGVSKIMVLGSKIIRKMLYNAYLKEYMKITKANFEDIDKWILPIAAARLKERVDGEQQWLLDIIKDRMKAV